MAKVKSKTSVKIEKIKSKYIHKVEKLSYDKMRLQKDIEDMEIYYLTKIKYYREESFKKNLYELLIENKLLKDENHVLKHKLRYFTKEELE